METLSKNRTLILTLIVLLVLFLLAVQGMSTKDWVVTLLRSLSVGAITFLVASGFSIILGLMDVLNLAHGTLFMIGAYVGWSTYVRPDTVVDMITPLLLLAAGFALTSVWRPVLQRLPIPASLTRIWPWVLLLLGLLLVILGLTRTPIAIWDPEVFTNSPIAWTQAFETGALAESTEPAVFEPGQMPVLVWGATLVGSTLLGLAIAGLAARRRGASVIVGQRTMLRTGVLSAALVILALVLWLVNTPLTDWLLSLDTTLLFFLAVVVATGVGAGLGALMEATLIRPLYERALYQIMLTFGLAFIGTEIVRAIWGRTGFTMPKPSLFASTGEGCPATSLAEWWQYHCSTIVLEIGGETARIRTYNEVFVILVGLVVLVVVWVLLQRTRLGMIIRAGVQDSEMVEAMGINVRRVFTMVFALGVGLAALGGVVAAPASGLSDTMGATVLLASLIALAIGGLTSFPGAALGSVIVGLLQQFIIKYGQIGINLPFLDEPWKPTPPLVPASTVLLMVIILLIMPQGLLGRKE